MGRPRKQTVDYFPHSCTHKKTMYILEQRYGNDGYAFWFKLLEMIGDSEGHYIDLNNEANWEFLQAKTRLTADFTQEILDLLAKLEAIDPELWGQRVVWSQKFVDGIADAYRNRRVDTPVRPDFYITKSTNSGVSDGSLQSESRILNETILDNNPPIVPPETPADIDNVPQEVLTLYEVLQGTKGFPTRSNGNEAKLQEIMADYPDLNYTLEFKAFRDWWNSPRSKKLQRPWPALRNWLKKAREGNEKARSNRSLPTDYGPASDYNEG